MFDRFSGVRGTASGEGTHFLVPWLQRAILYDVRIKPRNISTTTGSKDMQMVSLTLRVMSRPDVSVLPKIYQNLGLDYDERVLPSIGNEVLKATVAQFDAAELITQREVVSARIRADLMQRAKEFNILLEDVSIVSCFRFCQFMTNSWTAFPRRPTWRELIAVRRIDMNRHLTLPTRSFGKEFTTAVEQKQIAQQDAERAKFVVEKVSERYWRVRWFGKYATIK
jgi:prohibitin 1